MAAKFSDALFAEPSAEPAQAGLGCLGCDAAEEPIVSLAGQICRFVVVDGVVPHHEKSLGSKGVRLTYADGEIVHFDFGGHRYALVADALREELEAATETKIAMDMSKLLTCRELQIVQLVSMGLLTKQVADRLHISQFTVRSYLKTIYAKLGVRSRASLVFCYMKAFKQGA